jgi:HD domain-containing protein
LQTRAATHSRHGRALERSLTLLRVFLVASAAILLVGGVVLGTELSSALRAGDLGETLRTGRAEGAIDELSSDEDAVERRLGFDHVLEVYAPITAGRGGKVIGAYEIYADPRTLQHLISSRRHVLWVALAVVFLALYVALALLVRGASNFLRSQTDRLRQRSCELMDSYNRLEQSSLEAIETLNATVEAKDPYTAGHPQRVQQITLAVGEDLRLTPDRLDALRYAGLFHDIGKLAVRDAILTKPGPLDVAEFEAIKRHPVDGAAIVGKLGRLRPTVPLIRHHQERWDGNGYPDRLGGDTVPLEAYVGLADAWDAMTTDRPYQRAFSWEEAAEELRNGRGSQFAPEVVDAFFQALRRGALPGSSGAELERAAG